MVPLHRHRPTAAERASGTANPAAETPSKRIKESAETATAVAKALLFFGAIAIVGAVIATTLWRDQHARHVEVTIDPEAERVLRVMGSQVDLRQTFIDVLNDRVANVRAIFSLQLAQLIDTRSASDVSFKPFGLDASTGQITKLARELTGAEAPANVRVELACSKAKCDEAGAVGQTLLVTIADRNGSERVAIPIDGRPAVLRRRLRDAMRRSADRLLERVEPLFTAVYFLNVSTQRLFADDVSRDLQRAMASALKLRDANGAASCVSNLVVGGSLLRRGDEDDGLRAEQRAARSGDRVCQIHAATNIVIFLSPSVCDVDAARRATAYLRAREALAAVQDKSRFGLDDLVKDRIPSSELLLADMAFMSGADQDRARFALCLRERIADGASPTMSEKHIADTLARVTETLPPRTSPLAAQAALRQALDFERFAIPKDAVLARSRASLAIRNAVDDYLPAATTPRLLYAIRGHVVMELAAIAEDALAMDDGIQREILAASGKDVPATGFNAATTLRQEVTARRMQARIDFENALAAEGSPYIGETEITLATAAGDTALMVGDASQARDSYARAVRAFVSLDEPTDQLLALADAAAPLAALDRASGLCITPGSREEIGERAVAAQLGMSMNEWCALADGNRDGASATPPRPEWTKALAALVKPSMTACGPMRLNDVDHPDLASRWLGCVRARGPSSARVQYVALQGLTGQSTATSVEESLQSVSTRTESTTAESSR